MNIFFVFYSESLLYFCKLKFLEIQSDMTKHIYTSLMLLVLTALMPLAVHAQDNDASVAPEDSTTIEAAAANELSAAEKQNIQNVITAFLPEHMGIGTLKATSMELAGDSLKIDLSENFGDVPFTPESIEKLKSDIKSTLGGNYSHQKVYLYIAGNDIENYFSEFENSYSRKHEGFVTPVDENRHYKKGLSGNIVAMWPSHGWYFEPYLNRWEWQRARMFQTVEDMYTHSYILPYVIPMLENAGAYVWNARERDTHNYGAVVDNDGGNAQSTYHETNGSKKWKDGEGNGFAYNRDNYRDFENPFEEGTYRMIEAEKDKKKLSTASWDVDMPEAGTYAIYVSYKSLPNSAHDATYTINSLNGSQQFTVDQTMAGGVWVYLGSFELAQGLNKDVVTLSNHSNDKKAVITADAIKVGGGKGNIVRRVALPTPENQALAQQQGDTKYLGKEGIDYQYVGSGDHPWFHLGARYFLQWSGFPHQVYSTSNGINDYVDDYRSRGEWVNWLAGGSDVLPGKPGLRVPVDVSFCLHTDAGTTNNDDIIGTLLIYCTTKNGRQFGRYENGTPRELSRQFANIVSTEVVNDIRAKYEPNWTRRGMWDKSYYEARVPEVPALLMELLSHQNFADMKYGLDPEFRFDVSRSIYKGIAKFIAKRDHRECVIQPLPVNSFTITKVSETLYMLNWEPTPDPLCSSAVAKKYIVLEQVGTNGGFKEIEIVDDTHCAVYVEDNEIHSYKIVAMNEGGRSFPSETLSLGVAKNSKGTVMVINDFTRVSGPDRFDSGKMAGFYDSKDHGVPYMEQINYLGSQFEFRRHLEWRDDDAPGFGASRSNYETQNIAGNTFNYPALHGAAIMNAGYSFVSTSVKAVEKNDVDLSSYTIIDLIVGKQKETPTGRGAKPSRFKALTPALMNAITAFTRGGGNVLMTGAYVGSDIWDKDHPAQNEVNFAQNVMGYTWVDGRATMRGEVYSVPSSLKVSDGMGNLTFYNTLNSDFYAVESPDAIKASDERGATILRYSENNIPAGIASNRYGYKTVVVGFPFETIKSQSERNEFMGRVLDFFTGN